MVFDTRQASYKMCGLFMVFVYTFHTSVSASRVDMVYESMVQNHFIKVLLQGYYEN